MEDTNVHCSEINQISRKPLMLDVQKWNNILQHLNKGVESQKCVEEKLYKEYLKKGSLELMRDRPNVITKSINCKISDGEIKSSEGSEEQIFRSTGENLPKNILEKNLEDTRQDKIKKIRQIIQPNKTSLRELDSAAILSEVIKGREIQRQIDAEYNKAIKENKMKEDRIMQAQSIAWIEKEQKKMVGNRKRAEEYKGELLKCIKDEEKKKIDRTKDQLESERKLKDQADRELMAQIERERLMLQRKKEAMRRNALEAMKMVEQRRLRNTLENEIDNQINLIFSKGKQAISDIKMQKEKQIKEARIKNIEYNTEKLQQKMIDNEAIEKQRLQEAVNELNAKYEQQENEKLLKQKLMKNQRMKFYAEELERQKALQTQQAEQLQCDIDERLSNEKVTEAYEKMKIQEKLKRGIKIEAALNHQMKEKEINQKAQRELEREFENTSLDENKDFFDYATKLIDEAKKKSRPTFPLLKVVEKYKKQHGIQAIEKEQPHLKSDIPIGKNIVNSKPDKLILKYNIDDLKKMNPFA